MSPRSGEVELRLSTFQTFILGPVLKKKARMENENSRKRFVLLVGAFAFLATAVITFLVYSAPNRVGTDQTMYLQAADLMFSGLQPYVDFIDYNPPLIIYLSLIPVLISKLSGFKVIFTAVGLVLVLLTLCAFLLGHVLYFSNKFKERDFGILIFCYFFLSVVALLLRCFGQREHLFALAFIPYIFLRLFRCEAGNEIGSQKHRVIAIAIGLICGVMASLKPHFIFTVLVFEVCHYILHKNRRFYFNAEIISGFFMVFAYSIHFLFLPNSIKIGFFDELLPLVIKNYTSTNTTSYDLMIQSIFGNIEILFFGIIVVLIYRNSSVFFKKIIFIFGSITLASWTMYLLQGKGWNYHQIPTHYFVIIFSALAAIECLNHREKYFKKQILLISLSIGAVFCAFFMNYYPFYSWIPAFNFHRHITFGKDAAEILSSAKQYLSKGDHVVVFSPHPKYFYPNGVYMGYFPGTRYLFMFPLSYFNNRHLVDEKADYQYRTLNHMPPDEQKFVTQIEEDIEKFKPEMLVFPSATTEPKFLPSNFNVLKYFQVSGSFAKWQNDYLSVIARQDLVIYIRKNRQSAAITTMLMLPKGI